ncbi:hypothetical protein MPER_03442 [Moniliophthora perniciosa FA553]|nr:hypothetical protein MPER_03442 [Moniliophthora perniciosa FA553]
MEKSETTPEFGGPSKAYAVPDGSSVKYTGSSGPSVKYTEFDKPSVGCIDDEYPTFLVKGDDTPALGEENVPFATESKEEQVYARLESMESKLDRMQSTLKQEIGEIRGLPECDTEVVPVPAYPMAFYTQ